MSFKPITLKTERLLIRPVESYDLENIYKGLSNPEVVKYYGVSYKSLESTKEQMDFYNNLLEAETGMYWSICSNDNSVFYGVGGFNNLSKEHRKAEVGFWLLPQYWGNGFMSEGLNIICSYAFKKLYLHRLEGFIETENHSCIKAIKKLGFEYEGTMKNCEIKNGKLISLAIYAKLNNQP